MPRRMACGGGLTPKARALVPASAMTTVEHYVHRVQIRGGRVPPFVLDEPAARIAMVERSAFDLALTEAAADAGAVVREQERVTSAIEDEHGVTLRTARARYRFDVVVAADGGSSTIATCVGLASPHCRRPLALQVDLPLSPVIGGDTAVLEMGLSGGYAWYFPKVGRASVGVGATRTTSSRGNLAADLRHHLADFARSIALDVRDGRIRGRWVSQGLRTGPLSSARVVLVGDAAGTVDPLLGEGIAYGMWSGVQAERSIREMATGVAPDLRQFDLRVRQTLGPVFQRLRLASMVADRATSGAVLAFGLSRSLQSSAVDVIAGRRAPFRLDDDVSAVRPAMRATADPTLP